MRTRRVYPMDVFRGERQQLRNHRSRLKLHTGSGKKSSNRAGKIDGTLA